MPLLPEHLVGDDPFENWIVNNNGKSPIDDASFIESLRNIRLDQHIKTIQERIGSADYIEDVQQHLGSSLEKDVCYKAMGIRTLAQMSRVDRTTAKLIDETVSRHSDVIMKSKKDQQIASKVIEKRSAAWENDDDWLDVLDVKDDAMKAELETLHQRARQEFDISVLGGLPTHTDSLKELKGIGSKLEMYLYAMGIRSYAQLAQLTPEIEAKFDALVGVVPGRLKRAKVVEQCLQKIKENDTRKRD
jgi:predicted flap endonuclease-1-like 5' DNA nuclease